MPVSQSAFRAALLDPAQPVPAGLVDGAGAPTTKRFAVYRNNVTVALVEALHTAFPILVKLLGAQNFAQLAPLFVRAHPPTSQLMMHYGQAMPAFLEGFAPLAHIGYLADVARLELALRASYHAADAAAMDPGALAGVAPDVLMRATLTLAPAVICIPSPWPLYDIWHYNTAADAPKPRAIGQPVLITRPAFDPAVRPLTPAQAAWVTAIADGATLSDAQDAAATVSPDFDLASLLGLLVQQGALTDFTTPKE